MINSSLIYSFFPEKIKIVKVLPALKTGDPSDHASYRIRSPNLNLRFATSFGQVRDILIFKALININTFGRLRIRSVETPPA